MSQNEAPVRKRPPMHRRFVMSNVGLVFAVVFAAALTSSAADMRLYGTTDSSHTGAASNLAALASMLLGIGLCFRRRPHVLPAIAALALLPPLLLPADSLTALIALGIHWYKQDDERVQWALTAGAFIATSVAIWRDTRADFADESFWLGLFRNETGKRIPTSPMPLWQVVLIAALLTGAAIGIALIRRGKRDVQVAEERRQVAQNQAQELQRENIEFDEREALAREVHDVLGHRLSLIAMQANALEIEAEDAGHPDIQARAKQIQSGAQGSMTDLRSLLAMLRSPGADDERHNLADIAQLVDECIEAGTPVASSIFIEHADEVDPVVSRSAYRIVMELLTNARKHSPGRPARLSVTGSPTAGLNIQVSNPMPSGPDRTGVGSGRGLIGVGQRVNDLGGRFGAGPNAQGDTFVASATLPWTRGSTPEQA